MVRELLLAILAAILAGSIPVLLGGLPALARVAGDARAVERALWNRLFLPLLPAAVALAALLGWALQEPADAEQAPWPLVVAAVPFGVIWLRAILRAAWSALRRAGDLPAATVGLLAPRVRICPRFAASLDERARDAAVAHERAHARHRDPLRLWTAQIAADLQWPRAAAGARFEAWLRALELARDEEVRREGVAGEDLAAAIVAASRLAPVSSRAATASLGGEAAALQERILRLLAPLPPASPPGRLLRTSLLLVVGLLAAIAIGLYFGEAAVRSVFDQLS